MAAEAADESAGTRQNVDCVDPRVARAVRRPARDHPPDKAQFRAQVAECTTRCATIP